MSRTLILTRHAKSSWENPALADRDRPLNKRGKRAAKMLGDWFRRKDLCPDQVLSSDSRRTRETYTEMGLEAEATFTDDLYHVTRNQMLRVLSRATGDLVLMLGHNPAIGAFAAELAITPPDHARFFDYPTGATTVLRFDIDDWQHAGWHGGEVMDFVVPRDLPE